MDLFLEDFTKNRPLVLFLEDFTKNQNMEKDKRGDFILENSSWGSFHNTNL